MTVHTPSPAKSTRLIPHKFTVTEYDRMVETGILTKEDRVELLAGEIIAMSPIGLKHASCVKRLNRIFHQTLGDRVIIGVQDPLELGKEWQPQPDVMLLRPRSDFYATRHPQPQDLFLLVEVSESTALFDQRRKVPQYAQEGIPEVWVLRLDENCIIQYREPVGRRYQSINQFRPGESITLQLFPDVTIPVSQLLGE